MRVPRGAIPRAVVLVATICVVGTVGHHRIEQASWWRSRMIEQMSGHEIVCGYGRMGRVVVEELQHAQHPVVLVERNAERAQAAEELGIATIVGDASRNQLGGFRLAYLVVKPAIVNFFDASVGGG